MSESVAKYPSKNAYEGPKLTLGKEGIEKIVQEIDLLSADEVEKRLEKFRETIPGKKENANTFEMLALYQKTLGILGYSIPIDGRFGKRTYTVLKDEAQGGKLGLSGGEIDGLPGPVTTKAMIRALKEHTRLTGSAQVGPSLPKTAKGSPSGPGTGSKEGYQSIDPMEREILDFTQENIRVRAIIEKAKSPSPISKWSGDGSFYNGISLRRIDYAVIKQDDGEYYVFDKPEAGIRKVYRTDGKMNVIAMASVDIMGTLTLLKNQKESTLRAPFMPTLIVKKNKP